MRTTYPTHSTTYPSGLTIENYKSRPADGDISPPGSYSAEWPTGFSGHGWLVKDATGTIVFAGAWRLEALNYAGEDTA